MKICISNTRITEIIIAYILLFTTANGAQLKLRKQLKKHVSDEVKYYEFTISIWLELCLTRFRFEKRTRFKNKSVIVMDK